jgi:hypothetical protein
VTASTYPQQAPDLAGQTKRQVKRGYVAAQYGLTDTLQALMFDHGMCRGEALRYMER